MDQELQNAEKRVVGTKQVLRALNGSNAARVFLAKVATVSSITGSIPCAKKPKPLSRWWIPCRSWESSAPSASKPRRRPC